MDCRNAADLLPWYRNGTLDAAEREELERHLAGCAGCRDELRQVEAAALLFGDHPTPEQLVEHAAGAPGAPAALIEAHLGGCATCAEELAMVLASRRDVDPNWAAEPPAAADPARVVPLRRPPGPRPAWRAAAAAAAVIGLVGVASGLWSWRALDRQRDLFGERQRAAESRIAELESELRGVAGARLNVPIHDLWPDGSLLRSADSGPAELAGAGGPAATLILNSQLEPGVAVDRLEVRAGDGRLLHSLDGVRIGPGGGITMSLDLARLPRGALRILLFGPDSEEPLESYSFELD